MRRTIAYVDHAAQVGGAEKSLVELIAHLDHQRYKRQPLRGAAR